MKKVKIGNQNFNFPSSWNEMTVEQLCFLAKILKGQVTTTEIKLKMALFSIGARVRRYHRAYGDGYAILLAKKNIYLETDQFIQLSSIFDFILKNENELDIKLTKNPFPKITVGKKVLYGPEDGLTNISYGQFIMLQTWQHRMTNDFNKYIDDFLAVIWKPDKFNASDVGDSSLLHYMLDNCIKTVMCWYYFGSINFISEKFPRIFPGNDAEQTQDVFAMQQRIVDEMAGGDVTKKDMVKQCLLYDALFTMDMAMEREEKKKKS